MLSDNKITEISCMADDFCKFFDETVTKHSFQVSDGKRHRNKPNRMSNTKVITKLVTFHMSRHCCLKHFYLSHVCKHWLHFFPCEEEHEELPDEIVAIMNVIISRNHREIVVS